jgi:hypothetical protein
MRGVLLVIFWVLGVYMVAGQNTGMTYWEGEDLAKKTEQLLYIKVNVDKKTAFEGESIRADYFLYVAVDLQGKLSKAPSFSGFASYDIKKGSENEYRIELINGTPYKIYHIKSVQLFGLSAGKQRIEPIALDATIRYQKGKKDKNTETGEFKPDTLFSYEVKSKPVDIDINPLPENKERHFTGAVGKFEISATLTSGSIAKEEPDTLQVALSGTGNWHEVTLPEIIFPEGLEVFEPLFQEALDETSFPLEGVKIFSFPFISNDSKAVVFQPILFSFFDPQRKIYSTISTDSLLLEVRNEAYKPIRVNYQPLQKNNDLTNLFSRFAIILFPLTALLLMVLVWHHFRKSRNS